MFLIPVPLSGSILQPMSIRKASVARGSSITTLCVVPASTKSNLSLGKVFRITESKSLEFKWETYNTTNHVNLVNPDSYIFDQDAGKIFGAADMRQMQFGLHFASDAKGQPLTPDG